MTTELMRFAFKLVHPVLYANTIIIQASGYSDAQVFASHHIEGTKWTIAQVKNMLTGEIVRNT